jgi:hypothetical protein
MSPNAAERSLVVGGAKGHEEESITGNLLCLYEAYDWMMIPNCTGRYTCRNHDRVSVLTPTQVLEGAGVDCSLLTEHHFSLPGRADEVRVISLDNNNATGVISYVKGGSSDDVLSGDRYVHTLNTPSGFQRKLQAIGIKL